MAAARKIKEKYPQFKFQLLGPKGDNNPAAISEEQLEKDVTSGAIEYLGITDDVQSIVGRPGTVVVLPSYHEGLSRSLMEACAMGKPIIASDIPRL